MSTVTFYFNHVEKTFRTEHEVDDPEHVRFKLLIEDADALSFSSMRVGISGDPVYVHTQWPDKDAVIYGIESGTILSAFSQFTPGQKANVKLTLELDGEVFSHSVLIEAEEFGRPFPSWSFVDGMWKAPKPFPFEARDKSPKWSEEKLDWVLN